MIWDYPTELLRPEVIGTAPRPAATPIAAAAPANQPPEAARSALDAALDNLDADDVVLAEIPNVATIEVEAIEKQIRFLIPELDNVRYNAIVQDLAEEALDRLQNVGGDEFRTEYQHELNNYRDVIKGAAPTRFLIRSIEERLAVHRRSIEANRAAEMIRIAEDDRAHPGKREELKDLFRRSMENAREAAGRR